MKIKKIILGSAQFGMDYGIANKNGQVHEAEIRAILSLARSGKIEYIDTASAYGMSETILGKLADSKFKIITKLNPLGKIYNDVISYVKHQCIQSLLKLNRDSCEGFLVHHAEDLLGIHGESIYQALSDLKAENKVKKIGVSVYSPDQVYKLTDRFHLDIIQLPLNILDQRFIQNNLLAELKQKKIEIHTRSIFLQGLLLMDPKKISNQFDIIKPTLETFHDDCHKNNITPRQACINFVTSIKEVDYCIFGIDTHKQLNEIITDVLKVYENYHLDAEKYRCLDLNIIHPSNWKIR